MFDVDHEIHLADFHAALSHQSVGCLFRNWPVLNEWAVIVHFFYQFKFTRRRDWFQKLNWHQSIVLRVMYNFVFDSKLSTESWPYKSGQQLETDCTCSQVERVSRSQTRTDAKCRPTFNIFKPTRALHWVTCSSAQKHFCPWNTFPSLAFNLLMLAEEKWPLYFSPHDRRGPLFTNYKWQLIRCTSQPWFIDNFDHCIDHILMTPLNFVTNLFII